MSKNRHPVLQRYFKHYGVKALLISDLLNVRLLSGFTGSAGTLLMTPKKNFFFSDFRYMTQASRQVKNFKIVEVARDSIHSIARQLKTLGIKKMGFEADAIKYTQYLHLKKGLTGVKLVPILEDPACVRMIKNPHEISKIKKALRVNRLAFQKTLRHIRAGAREDAIAFQLEAAIRKAGGEKLSFTTIVASGYRGAMPHGLASSKKIRKGELVTIDFGNVVEGYCSDETCTIGLGPLSKEQKRIYTIVKDAHDFAIEKMRPGMKGKTIDAFARDHITQKGFGKYFGHSLGHGIGLAVHERPMISPASKDTVQENMVFSVEPGIYIPKWGGVRIEDLVVCQARGGKVLSEIDKNLKIIDG